jgi:hypothetical protein
VFNFLKDITKAGHRHRAHDASIGIPATQFGPQQSGAVWGYTSSDIAIFVHSGTRLTG